MDFSARVATKDAARSRRRRSCTPPRASSTLPGCGPPPPFLVAHEVLHPGLPFASPLEGAGSVRASPLTARKHRFLAVICVMALADDVHEQRPVPGVQTAER